MATRTLADLQNAFKGPERSNNTNFRPSNYFPFHLMDYDKQAVVRFLPDKNPENPMGFLVEKIVHNLQINGNRRTVPCLSMYGEDCPICAVSQQYYKSGDEANGKKYWKKRQHIGQVLVLEDPLQPDRETGETHLGKVRYINLGYQLFGIIKSVFESGDLDEIPFAYEGGYNFTIAKKQQGEYPTYTLGSQFARRASDLTEEQTAYVEEEIVDLSTLLPKHPGLEKVEALLNSALTGAEYVDPSKKEDGEDSTAAFTAAVKKTAAKKTKVEEKKEDDDLPFEPDPVEKKVAAAAPAADDGEDDADAEDILAKIRQRRKSKNS